MLALVSASLATAISFCLVFVVCRLTVQALVIFCQLLYCVLALMLSIGISCLALVKVQSLSC